MRALAVLLSLFGPGSGQILSGRWRTGLVLALALVATSLALPWVGGIGLAAWVAVRLVAAVDAARGRALLSLGRLVGCAGLFAAVMTTHVAMLLLYAETFRIASGGDMPTLVVGDRIMVEKWDPTPARGDLIVFIYPVDPAKDFVKRVIGVAGDRVAVRQGVLTVNGEPASAGPGRPCNFRDFDERKGAWSERVYRCQDETLGIHHYTTIHDPRSIEVADFPQTGDYTVPAGAVFVMGDNRENSHDSRYWGPLPLANVKGKAMYVWYSAGGPDGIRWDRIGLRLN